MQRQSAPQAASRSSTSKALDLRHTWEVYPHFERDSERVRRSFTRYDVVADPTAIALDLWTRYEGGGLEHGPAGSQRAGSTVEEDRVQVVLSTASIRPLM